MTFVSWLEYASGQKQDGQTRAAVGVGIPGQVRRPRQGDFKAARFKNPDGNILNVLNQQ